MISLNFGSTTRFVELFQPFVAERLNHVSTIARCASRNNQTPTMEATKLAMLGGTRKIYELQAKELQST